MKKLFKIALIPGIALLFFLFSGTISAQINLPQITTACETKSGELYAFNDGFSSRTKCEGASRRVILLGEKGEKGEQGEQGPQGPQGEKGDPGELPEDAQFIYDVAQVRGSIWESEPTVGAVPTPDEVTVDCPNNCLLWINFDVDTRNTVGGFQHLYFIYVDGVDQAIFNQATMTTANAAVPLAVNGVVPVGPGEHEVQIYVQVYGGHLEQHESHLQVMAIGN